MRLKGLGGGVERVVRGGEWGLGRGGEGRLWIGELVGMGGGWVWGLCRCSFGVDI